MPKRGLVPVLGFCLLVVGVSTASAVGAVRPDLLAASPRAIAAGKFWLLVSSALLVSKPVVASLVSFAALAALAVAICGVRTFWLAAVLGHVCSTLLAYLLLVAMQPVEPGIFHGLVAAPDYGVSAMSSAWLGAIAVAAWQRRAQTLVGKASIIVSCVAVALFAWMLRGQLTVLDSEHVFAFAIGAGVVAQMTRSDRRAALAEAATA